MPRRGTPRKCKPGCTCRRHQNKGFKKGYDARTGLPTRPPMDRFMEKIERVPFPKDLSESVKGPCLMWIAGTRGGQAQFWDGERMAYGHIWIWKQKKGPIPKGFDLHHKCGRHLCMNTNHMKPLSHSDHARTPQVRATWFKKDSPKIKVCEWRGKEYTASRSSRRFCSLNCMSYHREEVKRSAKVV
jgi:hypothetical protein